MDLAVTADHRIKLKENEKKDKNLELDSELKKKVEHKSDGCTSCNWCSWYSNQKFGKRTIGCGNKRSSGDNPNNDIIKIDHNNEKSPGDLRRLALTQIPVKDYQLTLM